MFEHGYSFTYDVTLPFAHFYELVAFMRRRLVELAPDAFPDAQRSVGGFGHLGDCNLHLFIMCAEYTDRLSELIDSLVYAYVHRAGGSISAEHGIGFLKRKYLGDVRSVAALAQMRAVKAMMDPHGILNPYKVLPDGEA